MRAARSGIGVVLGPLALAAIITAVEYFARRGLAHLVPRIAHSRVNDMFSMAVAYLPLVAAVGWLLGMRGKVQLRRLGFQLIRFPRTQLFWLGFAFTGAAAALLVPVDRLLDQWFQTQALAGLLKWEAAGRSPAPTLLHGWGNALVPVALLLVNGVLVPLCEEFLWRGVIQRRLALVLGPWPAIAATAVLFSLKHAVVDASLGRLLFIVGLGTIWGYVAHRRSWHASAVLHAATNTLATLLMLVVVLLGALGLLPPRAG